jgi:acyl carrier protein
MGAAKAAVRLGGFGTKLPSPNIKPQEPTELQYVCRMTEKEFLEVVEVVSESSSGSLTLDSVLSDFGWDSLGVIGLISEIDRRFGITMEADSLAEALTVEDLYKACSK